ncbi:MAG: hypothetical protein V3T72_05545 [Thermoanaerobaculia bacterium]
MSELNRENRRSDATVIAKNQAMSRYDQQFRWIACCLESLYHLAGQHELAERVKPSTRRSRRTQADVEAEESGGAGEESESDVPGEEPETDGLEAEISGRSTRSQPRDLGGVCDVSSGEEPEAGSAPGGEAAGAVEQDTGDQRGRHSRSSPRDVGSLRGPGGMTAPVYLLDSHALIWHLQDSDSLSAAAREILGHV